jgi:hypothetical protein
MPYQIDPGRDRVGRVDYVCCAICGATNEGVEYAQPRSGLLQSLAAGDNRSVDDCSCGGLEIQFGRDRSGGGLMEGSQLVL